MEKSEEKTINMEEVKIGREAVTKIGTSLKVKVTKNRSGWQLHRFLYTNYPAAMRDTSLGHDGKLQRRVKAMI